MHTIKLRLGCSSLSEQMAAMRQWLDVHGFEPSVFNCRENHGELIISVTFQSAQQADAFGTRFGDRDGMPDGGFVHTILELRCDDKDCSQQDRMHTERAPLSVVIGEAFEI